MKKNIIVALAATLLSAGILSAQPQYKWYGFIRNYVTYDSHEGKSGTEDFFYYLPYDNPHYGAADDTDPYAISTLRFASLTSRLGLDVTGYQIENWTIGAKIEADFYSGVSGVTGTAQFRLRQAYMTMAKNAWSIKIGQAWHPMAADMPDVISLNTGAPFGPFSRTPLASADVKLSDALTLTGAAVWQMQYTSCGPNGSSADYMRFGMTPEIYLGLSYKQGGFLGRIGADVLSIKPRAYSTAKGTYSEGAVKVNDRITTPIFFAYAQYTKDLFSIKAKTTFAQGGDHLCLNGGYGVSAINTDGSWEYSATSNSSTWVSLKYGNKVQGVLFGGYVKNFGTKDEVSALYFSKNSYSNMTQMYRLSPTVLYNLGKVQFGLEYELTGVEYGTKLVKGLATENLHWVANNRIQFMAKYTF